MSNNWKPPEEQKPIDPNYKPEEFVKSEREQKSQELIDAHKAAPTKQTQKALLEHIEGDNFVSSEDGIKIILLNGPPRAGKDTAVDMAMNHLGKRGSRYRFAAPLKNTIHSMFGFQGVPEEHFSKVKDVPSEIFHGMTPREAYIWLSEQVVKPKFGHDFWSKIAVTMIRQIKRPVILISDCGFVEEAHVLTKAFGKNNVAIVQLFRDGCEFQTANVKDSRSYIEADCSMFKIENNGTVHDLYDNMVKIIDEFAGKNANA